ncbi:hypothetical protein PVW47_08685 [Marinovum sp. SP66]|uniref:tripartite tricarboxylate transporter TctB family protein n=1 Tax=Marinovum TaxID=367771 RepID=UPI00237B7107|nr:tripartite tricarboxylate transporter TctB family protein [Marinovum sp. SP66]MDD9739849.1 hypothetical protein [Marinovum sp. SP66]
MTAADRASGVFFVLFGLAMYFRVNPTYIETVDGGNLAPDTLPNVMALVIAACGALLVVKPSTHMMRSPRLIARAGLYSAVLAAGTFAMSHFGFEIAGPCAGAGHHVADRRTTSALAGRRRVRHARRNVVSRGPGAWARIAVRRRNDG